MESIQLIPQALDIDISQNVTISLQIYDLIGVNDYMCASQCPCEDVPEKNQWLNMTESELAPYNRTVESFDFSGTFTSYADCLNSMQGTIA